MSDESYMKWLFQTPFPWFTGEPCSLCQAIDIPVRRWSPTTWTEKRVLCSKCIDKEIWDFPKFMGKFLLVILILAGICYLAGW